MKLFTTETYVIVFEKLCCMLILKRDFLISLFSVFPSEVVIGLAVCACLLFFLVLLLFVVLCRQGETSTGYSHVINEGDENSWQSYHLLDKADTWDGEDGLWITSSPPPTTFHLGSTRDETWLPLPEFELTNPFVKNCMPRCCKSLAGWF